VELSGDYRVTDRISVNGNYTYTFGESANARLTRVPTHELIVGADFDVTDRFTTGLQITRVAGVVDGFGTATPLDDYTVVDLTARYDITDRANAYFTVRNLTNEKYETVRGYNTSERAFYVGVQADF
jgi:vitamin B12 transporter